MLDKPMIFDYAEAEHKEDKTGVAKKKGNEFYPKVGKCYIPHQLWTSG